MSEERSIDLVVQTKISLVEKKGNHVIIRFIKTYEVEPSDILEIRKAIDQLNDGSSYKVLVYPGQFGSISKEAREMEMFEISDANLLQAVAIVTKQLHQKLLGTIFFKIRPKSYPHKLFRREENAINWLEEV